MINDTSRPLVFLGSNYNIYKLYELCASVGYEVVGIIDDDYHSQGQFKDIPVIAQESQIADYREQYQFICATNWMPGSDAERNRLKRQRLLDLMSELDLTTATVVSNLAQVSGRARLGAGVIIDAFAMIEPDVTVGDHTVVSAYSVIGHNSIIGRNNAVQRYCLITSDVTTENDVYFGLCSRVCRSHVTLQQGTFIHPNIMLLRGTEKDEEVSLVGKDLRKVYQPVEIH
jgi:hypothetical protein